MRLHKPQRELLELCDTPARALELEVVRKPRAFSGVTTALETGKRNFNARCGLEFCQSATAWDAVCALSVHTETTGSGYFMRLFRAVQAVQARTRTKSVTLVFDDATSLVPDGLWILIKAAEDIQLKLGIGLRLVFVVGKRNEYFGRHEGERWVCGRELKFPLIGELLRARFRGWEWTRQGLVEQKKRDLFEYFEEPAAPVTAVASA